MQHDKTPLSSELNLGDEVEARVAQLWFWEGFYSKRGVDMQLEFGPENTQLTDLDLLAFDFDPSLVRHKYIGEAKTGTGKSAPKALDRILWQRGLRELVGAETAELTLNSRISEDIRETGRSMGIDVQSLDDLKRREERLQIDAVGNAGSHGPLALRHQQWVQKASKVDPDLDKSFRFLRSKVWFLDPYTAVKQTASLIESLSKSWMPGIEDDDKVVLRWLLAEAVSVFTLNVVTIAGHARHRSYEAFVAFVSQRLADGIIPAASMLRLSSDIDKFVAGLLQATNASPETKTNAMGAFNPEPPIFAPSLAELAWRLSMFVRAADVPRQIDFLAHERLVNRRPLAPLHGARLRLSGASVAKAVALITAFLRGNAALASEVSEALSLSAEPISERDLGASSPSQVLEQLVLELDDDNFYN